MNDELKEQRNRVLSTLTNDLETLEMDGSEFVNVNSAVRNLTEGMIKEDENEIIRAKNENDAEIQKLKIEADKEIQMEKIESEEKLKDKDIEIQKLKIEADKEIQMAKIEADKELKKQEADINSKVRKNNLITAVVGGLLTLTGIVIKCIVDSSENNKDREFRSENLDKVSCWEANEVTTKTSSKESIKESIKRR